MNRNMKTAALVLAMSSLATLQATPGLKIMATLGALTGITSGAISNHHLNNQNRGRGLDWATYPVCAAIGTTSIAGCLDLYRPKPYFKGMHYFSIAWLGAHTVTLVSLTVVDEIKNMSRESCSKTIHNIWNLDIKPTFGLGNNDQSKTATPDVTPKATKAE